MLLVLSLLGGGLVALLLLSSAASADAFTQRKLQQDNRELSLREQELGRQVAASEAPSALAEQARKLGLVEGTEPGFLVLEPRGSAKVVGSPAPAASPPTWSATSTSTPGSVASPPGFAPPAAAGVPGRGMPRPTPGPRASRGTPTATPGGTR